MSTAADPPPSMSSGPPWPPEAEEEYAKIRPLGRGAFGTVWMAKSKKSPSDDSNKEEEEGAPTPRPQPKYVAIKSIRTSTPEEKAYAKRESDILSEMVHPNVLTLLKTYDSPPSSKDVYVLCVLGLAHGPNIGKLLATGGALGLPVARLVARHLVSAVGYLHGRGVVHRDVKPDNCVLVRADMEDGGGSGTGTATNPETFDAKDVLDDDALWSDDADGDDAVSSGKYKLVLVDFGFARALSPDDIGDNAGNGGGEGGGDGASRRASQVRRERRANRGSVARVMVKHMSALGTRAFAAPEIKDKAREKDKTAEAAGGLGASIGERKAIETLADNVADYGMVSDAFSVGVTLREVLTGVPADVTDIAGYISAHDNFAARALTSLCCGGGSKKEDPNKPQPRRKRYRQVHQVPRNAASLVRDMTKGKTEDRLTVREAQDHVWIAGDTEKGEEQYDIPRGDIPSRHGDPIVFLKCVGGTGVQ